MAVNEFKTAVHPPRKLPAFRELTAQAMPLALIVLLMLGWWFVMIACQGEGMDLDFQRRRHPMWEWLLGGRVGEWLDVLAMRSTVGYWRRKFRHLGVEKFDVALKSRRYISKHHPQHFQERVLREWERRMNEEV